jgi:AraC family transcriptional regulator of adaptative response / DNA-3-methyladenine glycosylase II
VSRAFALINRGFLDQRPVEDLASALGIGARHLTRLFMKYVGAPPSAAARTRRLQLAKTLLDDTRMPISDIAFAAGFSSIRRFNAVFSEVYKRPPSAVRRGARMPVDGAAIVIRLTYRPPLDWPAVVRLLEAESTPGVEEVTVDGYRRTVVFDGTAGWLSVRPVPSDNRLKLCTWLPDYSGLRTLIERVRIIFDLNADPVRITRQLASDATIAPLLGRVSGVRLPGTWDGFEVAVHRLVARDVGIARAKEAMARLAHTYGSRLRPRPEVGPDLLFPDPRVLARSRATGFGLSPGTARDLQRLAVATARGAIRFDPTVSCQALVRQLSTVAGFDPPTAHWIAMRTLAEPDTVPFGAEPLHSGRSRGWTADSRHERWRPWRSYVAVLQASTRLAASRSA